MSIIYSIDTYKMLEGVTIPELLQLKGPVLFLGNPINGIPVPWLEGIPVEATLTNAYEIYRKNTVKKKLKHSSIHDILEFDGIVMIDSGGFQFQRHPEIEVDIDDIIRVQKDAKAEVIAILDHPLDLSSGKKENEERLKTTLENTEYYLDKIDKEKLLPVIHGYSPKRITRFIQDLKNIWGSNIEKAGIGSLVPIMKSYHRVNEELLIKPYVSSRKYLVDLVLAARRELPETFLHVFGVGASITSMYIFFTLGIDSVDSVAWRLQAAGGKIALPRIGTRKLRKSMKSWARTLTEEEWKEYGCKCPVCTKHEFRDIQNSWLLMAKHNVWTYINELELIRKAIEGNKFLKLAEERTRVTGFYSMFKYAKKKAVEMNLLDI